MPRPLGEQVVVITGASSGIGRETAIQFGRAGTAVFLAARNEEALYEVASIINEVGGLAQVVPTDVTDWSQMQRLATRAIEAFGRIDTWINNAGISIYATTEDTTVEEAEQIIRTNFMGVVHGVSAVLPHMKRQGYGTIINVGSVESQRALPLQSVYAASKHAVKGYTEALRLEQMYEKTGVQVTLVMPAGINTPLFNHARSKVGVKPMPVPPAYKPELAARAIVRAAESQQRDVYVGGAGFLFGLLQKLNPALLDRIMILRGSMFRMQTSDQPDDGQDNLFEPMPGDGRVHGDFGSITKRSLYTPLIELSPKWLRKAAMFIVPTGALVALSRKKLSS